MGRRRSEALDHLTQTVLAAQEAGKSYGKYVADEWDKRGRKTLSREEMETSAPPAKYPGYGPKVRKCDWCGAEFLPKSNNSLCCCKAHAYERTKHLSTLRRREKRRENAEFRHRYGAFGS